MRKSLSFRHLLSSSDLQQNDIEQIVNLAEEYRLAGYKKVFAQSPCRGLILATLFFEPSTRTRFSFESAMQRLGGSIITLASGDTSSVKKGESLSDTGRIISSYSDIIVARHAQIGSVNELASQAFVPVINAGDGPNQHPTQSLVDLYTIKCEKKRLENLKIGVVGDLKYGRAVNSLMNLMSRYKGNHFTLISQPDLALGREQKAELKQQGCEFKETTDLVAAIKDLDVLYVTRVQRERFTDDQKFEKVKDTYRLSPALISHGKKDLIIMHPLPRVNEIDPAIDELPQAKYFTQANYAVYLRMALLKLMIG